jgi:hypothetical protein
MPKAVMNEYVDVERGRAGKSDARRIVSVRRAPSGEGAGDACQAGGAREVDSASEFAEPHSPHRVELAYPAGVLRQVGTSSQRGAANIYTCSTLAPSTGPAGEP